MKHRMLLGAVLAAGFLTASLTGQDAPRPATPTAPSTPPLIPATEPTPIPQPPKPSETKPAARPAKPAKPTKPATAPKTSSPSPTASTAARPLASDLKPGVAVATQPNVNIRGQAAINSEIVTHIKRGDVVTVLETVTLKKHGADEPGKWAKVQLPTGSAVWAHSMFIDSAKTVKPNRLNLRSGPGENYSILGRIDKGTAVRELERKGEWIKLEAPTNAYGFAAAHLLSQTPAVLAAASRSAAPHTASTSPRQPNTVTVSPRPTENGTVVTPVIVATGASPTPPPAAVTRPPTPAPTPTPTPAPTPRPATVTTVAVPPPTTVATPPPAVVVTPPPSTAATSPGTKPPVAPEPPPLAETTPPPVQMTEAEPLIRRVVTREGIVRGSVSIQAPTYFVLRSLDNNKTINYLLSVDTNIVLRSFQHQRVIVVGEEVLDERWPNTPVIDVESIQSVP